MKLATAAFGRLCVETMGQQLGSREDRQPPSGGCVLKLVILRRVRRLRKQPPSGGCVLKLYLIAVDRQNHHSRLRAAVC